MSQRSHSVKWAGAKMDRLFEISVGRGRGRSLAQMFNNSWCSLWLWWPVARGGIHPQKRGSAGGICAP